MNQRLQVVFIGSGLAGLLFGKLLHNIGVKILIFERQSQRYVLSQIRAGVFQQGGYLTARTCKLWGAYAR